MRLRSTAAYSKIPQLFLEGVELVQRGVVLPAFLINGLGEVLVGLGAQLVQAALPLVQHILKGVLDLRDVCFVCLGGAEPAEKVLGQKAGGRLGAHGAKYSTGPLGGGLAGPPHFPLLPV